MSDQFVKVPVELLKELEMGRINTDDLAVWVAIARWTDWETGDGYPGVVRLGRETGLHRTTVMRSVGRLEVVGSLNVIRVFGASNRYKIVREYGNQSSTATGIKKNGDFVQALKEKEEQGTGRSKRPVVSSDQSFPATLSRLRSCVSLKKFPKSKVCAKGEPVKWEDIPEFVKLGDGLRDRVKYLVGGLENQKKKKPPSRRAMVVTLAGNPLAADKAIRAFLSDEMNWKKGWKFFLGIFNNRVEEECDAGVSGREPGGSKAVGEAGEGGSGGGNGKGGGGDAGVDLARLRAADARQAEHLARTREIVLRGQGGGNGNGKQVGHGLAEGAGKEVPFCAGALGVSGAEADPPSPEAAAEEHSAEAVSRRIHLKVRPGMRQMFAAVTGHEPEEEP